MQLPRHVARAHLREAVDRANLAAMSSDVIQCSVHGPARATFVCKHVASGEGLGFVYDDDAGEPWPDAMCTICASEPEWSDEIAMERIRLLCTRCWDEAFERNTNVRATDEPEWFRGAFERSKAKQDRWRREFRIDSFAKYQYCFDAGEAWVAFGDGEGFRVRCDAHVVGSWSPTSGTWLWGWANDHWDARVTEALVRVKRRGEREGVRSLTRSVFKAQEADAWDIACAVLDTIPEVEAVYRAPGQGSLFLAVMRTRWLS
jgi:hypothetical protein